MIIKNSGIQVPIDHPQVENIKNHLTRTIWDINNNPTDVKFYETIDAGGEKFILIPRYYNSFIKDGDEILDQTVSGIDISVKTNIVPRSESQKKSIEFLVNGNNGILCLEPGRGKTVIAIAAICEIGKKAIIYVHKTQLINGWRSEFLKHTDVKIENITVLTSRTYKKSLQSDIILCTQQTFMSLLRSNKRDDFLSELNSSGIGTLVVDEVHSGVGPQEFTKASLFMNCQRTYGLSATPERYDGNTDIIKYHLGDVQYFPPDSTEILNPKVYMMFSDFGVFKKNRYYICFNGKYSYIKYVRKLTDCKKYQDMVVGVIKKAYDSGRNILVVGNYVKPLLKIAGLCGFSKEDVGLFMMGRLTKSEILKFSDTTDLKTAFMTKRVVFATYSMARDGVSRDDIDCLVMTLPTNNVIQAAGRILRLKPEKKTPIVVDIVDLDGLMVQSPNDPKKKESIFVRKARARMKIYKDRNWEVTRKRI